MILMLAVFNKISQFNKILQGFQLLLNGMRLKFENKLPTNPNKD
jgi:hypothetical protein